MMPNDYIDIFSYCNKDYRDYFSIIPLNTLYKVFYYDNTNYSFKTDLPSLYKTINDITNNDLNKNFKRNLEAPFKGKLSLDPSLYIYCPSSIGNSLCPIDGE